MLPIHIWGFGTRNHGWQRRDHICLSGRCLCHSSICLHIPCLVFTGEWYSVVHMYWIFIIHSLVERRLSCFHFLAVMNRTLGNAREEVVESFGHWPRSGVAGSCGRFFKKVFCRISILICRGPQHFAFPPAVNGAPHPPQPCQRLFSAAFFGF